jgi:hypothetical protein
MAVPATSIPLARAADISVMNAAVWCCIVPSGFDQKVGLMERVENLSVKELVAQAGVKVFNVALIRKRCSAAIVP